MSIDVYVFFLLGGNSTRRVTIIFKALGQRSRHRAAESTRSRPFRSWASRFLSASPFVIATVSKRPVLVEPCISTAPYGGAAEIWHVAISRALGKLAQCSAASKASRASAPEKHRLPFDDTCHVRALERSDDFVRPREASGGFGAIRGASGGIDPGARTAPGVLSPVAPPNGEGDSRWTSMIRQAVETAARHRRN
ncbi:unnamed protein product, partial [Iphiclides podalirius]